MIYLSIIKTKNMTKQVIVDVPLSHITNPEELTQEIRDIHSEFEPDERAQALAAFVLTQETDFGVSLGEITMQAAQSAAAETAEEEVVERSLFSGKKPKGDSVKITVDTEAGQVTEAQTVRRLPVDRRATARSKSISDRTGYGPKQNGSSFKTNSIDPTRRSF